MSRRVDPKKAEKVMLRVGLQPIQPFSRSHDNWRCKCLKCKRIVSPRYHDVRQDGSGCGYCSGNLVDPKDAVKIMLKAQLKPLEPYKNSKTPWKSKCLNCGHIASPSYGHVKQHGSGCTPCGRKRAIDAKRIPAREAKARMIKAGFKPLEPFVLARNPWKSKCIKCKKISYPSLTSATTGRYDGCAYCSKNRTDEKDAIKVMRKAKLKPLEPYRAALSEWKCKCLVCGLIVYPTYNYIQQGHGGCNPCGIQRRIKASKKPEKEAVAIMLKARIKPLEPYTNSNTGWKCRCLKCKTIIYPSLGTIIRGSGCGNCSPYGIDLEKPSYIYLITNKELYAHKIGMGNRKKIHPDRLKSFLNLGWKAHKVWNIRTGAEALKIETAIFKIIRKELKLPIYLTSKQMSRTGGETETVGADSITLLELEKIINKVIKGYKQ